MKVFVEVFTHLFWVSGIEVFPIVWPSSVFKLVPWNDTLLFCCFCVWFSKKVIPDDNMFYVLPPHHPQLKNVNLKAEATLAKGCLATSKAGRGDAACSSHCSRPARSQTCGGLKGTSTIVDWLFYNVSYALLTSFCMKDNPEVGFFLRGGRKGRKAWEIEEEATLVTINLTTLFPRWSSQVPWLGYSWWIASASLFLSMSLCLYLSFVYVFVFVFVLCYLWNKTPV